MKSEIQLAFQNCKKEKRPALITYTVASDPNKKKSLEIYIKYYINFNFYKTRL